LLPNLIPLIDVTFSTPTGRYTHRRVAAGSSTGTVQQVQHIQVKTGAGTEPAAKTCCVAEEELILLATRFLIDAGCIPQTCGSPKSYRSTKSTGCQCVHKLLSGMNIAHVPPLAGSGVALLLFP